MQTRTTVELAGLAVLLLLGAVGWGGWQRERGRLREETLRLENARAELDTTRVELVAVLGDTVAVFERLVVQREVELREALQAVARLRGLQAAARAQIALLTDSLAIVTTGTVDTSGGELRVEGRLDASDTLGVLVEARVHVNVPAATSSWAWLVVRQPITLELTLLCEGTTARAAVVAPPWARLELEEVEQRPELCNPVPRYSWRPFSLRPPSVVWSGVLFGAGLLVGSLR